MRTYKSILGSIVGGVAITLVTGLIRTPGASLIGGTGYGFPMTWVTRRVLAPQYFPWFPHATGLIVDIVIWFIIIEILWLAGCSWKGKGAAPKKSSAKSTRKRKR
jgi:hypothetical protein